MLKHRIILASIVLAAAWLTTPAHANDAEPSPVTADQLGAPANLSGGASTGDSSALQPAGAGTSTLQPVSGSAGTLGAGGSAQTLQGSTPSDETLQVLGAEADGERHDPNPADTPGWVWVGIVAGSVLIAELVMLIPFFRQLWRRRRQVTKRRRQ